VVQKSPKNAFVTYREKGDTKKRGRNNRVNCCGGRGYKKERREADHSYVCKCYCCGSNLE